MIGLPQIFRSLFFPGQDVSRRGRREVQLEPGRERAMTSEEVVRRAAEMRAEAHRRAASGPSVRRPAAANR